MMTKESQFSCLTAYSTPIASGDLLKSTLPGYQSSKVKKETVQLKNRARSLHFSTTIVEVMGETRKAIFRKKMGSLGNRN